MNSEEQDVRNLNSFYWEESSVQLSGATEDLNIFKQHCNALRECVCTAWKNKKSGEKINSSTFASLLISIKELNRKTQFRVRKARQRTAEQKLGVDKLHLSLQNLLYEVAHLENEIKTCLEFNSRHEKLKLIPIQEFCQVTGRTVSLAEIPTDFCFHQSFVLQPSNVSTHEGTLERLYWELEQRKELSNSVQKLQQAVEAAGQKLDRKREYLSSFGPKLKELIENTLQVQEVMDLPFTKEEEQYDLALILPSPLYILYAHLKSYISMSGDESSQAKLQLRLTFAWLIKLKLVTVRMQLKSFGEQALIRSTSGSDLLCSELLLTSLNWLDPTHPPADCPVVPQDSVQQWNACQPIGRPYSWAQELCGLHCLMDTGANGHSADTSGTVSNEVGKNQSYSPQFGRIDAWLHSLERRIHDRLLLIGELTAIETGHPPLSAEQQNLLPPLAANDDDTTRSVKLTNWRRTTFVKLQAVPRAQVPISFGLIQPTDAIFTCEFNRGESFSATVWIALPLEYPQKAPLLIVDSIKEPAASMNRDKTADSGLSELHLQVTTYSDRSSGCFSPLVS
ncbi:THO complex subunit 5 [Paragonimus westermani]|uniref:THO complex subunit 5 n=1 Tax=Paragonimus westermani TaxID=34504 RepID=A0A5J4NGI0_9TREM|nr:THO complex subunit 5 [Paragonimus westermani]